jgi:hypothetical protein
VIEVHRARVGIEAFELDHDEWGRARAVRIERYWSGEAAPEGRHAEARVVWTDEALCVRFLCRQDEPFIISDDPRLEEKTIGLWDRDVCELFVAPDARTPERYFEFEVAPTGEWVDLAIHQTAQMRETNWRFKSGMTAAARVSEGSFTIVMCIPWAALVAAAPHRAPRAGERWRANLCRCVGAGEQRGYLAWQPTETPQPNFHVPEKFGWLKFKDEG